MNDNTLPPNSMDNQIVRALLEDRRRERRWRNIRFFVWFLIILILIGLLFTPKSADLADTQPYVSLVQINGEIMPNTNMSANRLIPLLNKAFADKKAKGVVLLVNSPGGSAVQAAILHDKIIQLKQKYKKKVVVVGEDTVASGAYLLSTAADKIYVNDNTLTGSIGVIYSGFGLNDLIQKVGVTRRVFTAGTNKDRLDPFQPLDPNDVTKIHQVLDLVHQNFINYVLKARQGKLTGDQKELFSGDFWIGQEAVKLGLVDGTGNLWDVMQSEFGVQFYRNYGYKPSLIEMIVKNINTELHLSLNNRDSAIQAILPNVQ